jgi:hypothetical protein
VEKRTGTQTIGAAEMGNEQTNGGAAVLLLAVLIWVAAFWVNSALAQVPTALAAPGETVIVTYHAEGAQIYECKADSDGKLSWVFREPIATLLLGGKTVGRHYTGPTWELTDGSAVTGKVVGNAPGATANDIPWLKLKAMNYSGSGLLTNITTIERINTHGGAAQGACDQAGAFSSVAYSADYIFLSKEDQDYTPTIPRPLQRQ